MMRYIVSIAFLFFLSLSTQAQQEHQFTQFMYNKVYYNPAFAGSRGVPSITALYRNQWLGFDGSPISQLASFETPMSNQNAGIGFLIGNYNIGIMNSWQATLSYNYNIKFSENSGLRLGLSGSLRTLNIDFSDPDAIIRQPGDNSINTGDQTNYSGNFGIGGVLEFNKFHIGVSSPFIFPNEIGQNDGQSSIAEYATHIYGIIGARPNLTENIVLQPTVILKYVQNAPFDFDANLSFLFNDVFLLGSSYRYGGTGFAESIDFNMFYQIVPTFGIGAAYDVHLDEVSELGTGSLEFLARFDFGGGAGGAGGSNNILENPRYFF